MRKTVFPIGKHRFPKQRAFAALFIRQELLFVVLDGLNGAVLCAGAAGNALFGIDLEFAVSLKNSLCGAVFLAGAAGNAIITDNKCHGVTSL